MFPNRKSARFPRRNRRVDSAAAGSGFIMNEYLTSALPGIGGALGEDPADFFVEEIPLYQPCGSGEHLYLTVEKRGLTTYELLNRVARRLGIRERDLGYAGLKDAR